MRNFAEHKAGDNEAARRVTSWLHPRVYALLMACALWFVLAAWSFAGAGVTDYLLFIVSGFIFAIPIAFMPNVGVRFIFGRTNFRSFAVAADRP